MASWLYGFMIMRLYGYMASCRVIWLHVELYDFMVIWLHGYMASWLYGFMVVCLHGYMALWVYVFMQGYMASCRVI